MNSETILDIRAQMAKDAPEKPLHVKVAEVLGWIDCYIENGVHLGRPPIPNYGHFAVPNYDTDWSATGPLIEKYALHIAHAGEPGAGSWSVTRNGLNEDGSVSDTWYREDLLLHAI
jgi:hypothetical protein